MSTDEKARGVAWVGAKPVTETGGNQTDGFHPRFGGGGVAGKGDG